MIQKSLVPSDESPALEETHPNSYHLFLRKLFSLFFDEDVYLLIISRSKRYAKQEPHHSFQLTNDERNVFR